MAHRGGGVIPEGGLLARLGPMPVSALRIDANIAEGLVRLGLHRIGDLAGMARAKHFGPELLQRMDQALRRQAEPVAAEADPPHFWVRMTLPELIGLTADVMGLLIRLCDKLNTEGQGARKLVLEQRGSLLIWLDKDMAWRGPRTGGNGRPAVFSGKEDQKTVRV